MPIGIYRKEKESFTKHEIDLNEGDTFYLFSDGFVDQFGGPYGRRFLSSQFTDLLMSIQNISMSEQKQILDKTIEDWKAYTDSNGKSYEQIDDILVLGVKV